MSDLARKLRDVSAMIHLGERISFGQETMLMDEAADTIERLIRERDEARARVAELENIEAVEAKIAPIILKAVERGCRKGVEDAAKAAWRVWTASNDVGETGGKMYAAILDLLEQTEPGEKK